MKYTYEDVDERIIRTKLALSNAMIDIIKNGKKARVSDICKKANITRMTYYHHFHNKTQLVEFVVNEQLQGILPIPKKLKPINIRQLIGYLLKSFILFFCQHKVIISASIKNGFINGYKNSYIYLLMLTARYWIYCEIKRISNSVNALSVQIWSDIITYVILSVLIKRINNLNQNYFAHIWNSFKELRNNL